MIATMNHWNAAGLVLVLVFGSAMLGVFLQTKLPAHRRDVEPKVVAQLVTGLLASGFGQNQL